MNNQSVRNLPVSSISRGSALIALVAGLFLSAVTAGAAEFTLHTNIDIQGLDISAPGNPLDLNPPLANDEAEVRQTIRSATQPERLEASSLSA